MNTISGSGAERVGRCVAGPFAKWKVAIGLVLMAGLALAPVRLGAESPTGVKEALTSILKQQATAWNRGDIDDFMQPYWKSEQLTFSSGGKTTRGWAATKARYQKRYPDRATMGKLTFSRLEVTALAADAALVLGKWHLQRDKPIGGNFSLVFQRLKGRWLIVHDHSSALAEKK